jgi:hypothetical protein
MLKKLTAQQIQRVFFVLIALMLPSLMASAQLVVNPDGSATIENVPLGSVYVGGNQSSNVPAVSQGSITVDFNELNSGQEVSPNQYIGKGLRIAIGPSSTTSGVVEGSLVNGPCDGTRSIQIVPLTGPSFLLRFTFPGGVTSVSLDAGDFGPSDSDSITVKAFGDDSLETIIDVETALITQGAPTGCVRLSVQASIIEPITTIKAVEITSASFYVLSSNSPSGVSSYPNSIFLDNVTFEPAPQTVP